MPESRNYRFANEIQVGTPESMGQSAISPTSPERAVYDAAKEVQKDPGKAIDSLIEQARKIADNKQKLISTVIKPMKGLDDKPTTPGSISPAEAYADTVLNLIMASSSIPENDAINMILEVWPVWQSKGYTWETFAKFIVQAASIFKNPKDVIEWSNKLFESMIDAFPVFTPEYVMKVALDALSTRNFEKYQNLLISLPFYKSVWSKEPISASEFSKAVAQVSTMMKAVQTPTADMQRALDNMVQKNKMVTALWPFYKQLLFWIQNVDTEATKKAILDVKNKNFQTGSTFEYLVKINAQMNVLKKTLGEAIKGGELTGQPDKGARKGFNKSFKTVLAAPPAPSKLQTDSEAARTQAYEIQRLTKITERRLEIIENNTKQIDNIIEQKAKGLSGDLGLFSSLVTSGNVVQKIDETLKQIGQQIADINMIIQLTEKWIKNHKPNTTGTQQEQDAEAVQAATLEANQMMFRKQKQDLNQISQSLKIQRIVLPKEIEYFELKQDYDTNVEQLKAPVSALMVNTLVTTRDNKGKLTVVNKRVARPLAIKSAWETGKQIVNLLMQISQSLQAGTNNSSLGQSMFKNATNYYKAAIKQEVENNKMLMENLTSVGLGQVNYTPVPVGKKEGR